MRAFIAVFCLSSSLWAQDHKVVVCEHSRETLGWALELIAHAEQSIDFVPCFFGGDVAQELLFAIEQRMQCTPKLKVYLLTSTTFLEPNNKALIRRLAEQYSRQFHATYAISVIDLTGTRDLRMIDNHVKALVVDELYFIVGGTNYDDTLCSEGTTTPPKRRKECAIGGRLPAGARDQDIVGRGPMARPLRLYLHQLIALWNDFEQTNRLDPKDPAAHSVLTFYELNPALLPTVERFESHPCAVAISTDQIRMVTSGPMDRENGIAQEYGRLIDGARHEIIIGNYFFAPVNLIFEKLLGAVNRGVKLTVITNGLHKNSPECAHFVSLPNRFFYLPVLYGKIYAMTDRSPYGRVPLLQTRIFEYNVRDVLYHKKTMVVDGETTVIGSYNFGLRSNDADYEIIMILQSPQIGAYVREVLMQDQMLSVQVSPQQAQKWYFDPFLRYQAEIQKKGNLFF